MFRFILLSLAITYVNAGNLLSGGALGALGTGYATGLGTGYATGLGTGYATVLGTGLGTGYATGLGTGYATGLGTGLGLSTGLGGVALGTGLGLSGGYGAALSGPVGPLPAAIQSRRTYEVRPVVLPQEPAVPQIIEVEPSEQPVQVVFRSVSSPVLVQQIHTPGAPGQVEATQSEDEPHRVVHEVLRPVIQEVREVIQPYRRVVQEVRPVVEEVHTVVAKGEPRLRTAVAPIAAKAAPIAYAQPVIESAPLLAKGYGGLGLGGYGKAAAKGAAA